MNAGPFTRHLRQRGSKVCRLGGCGRQTERTFKPAVEVEDDIHVHVELDSEPFSDLRCFLEVGGGEERSINAFRETAHAVQCRLSITLCADKVFPYGNRSLSF